MKDPGAVRHLLAAGMVVLIVFLGLLIARRPASLPQRSRPASSGEAQTRVAWQSVPKVGSQPEGMASAKGDVATVVRSSPNPALPDQRIRVVAEVQAVSPGVNLTTVKTKDGSVIVSFSGIPGRTYAIEYAADQPEPNWQRLATRKADDNGQYEWVDSPAPHIPQIYRSVAIH